MNSKSLLELYTQQILAEGLGDVEKFLDNRPNAVEKEKLLAKVLAEEQKVEDQRRELEMLMAEHEELNKKTVQNADRLKSVHKMRQELETSKQSIGKCAPMNDKTFLELCRMKKEVEALDAKNQ